MASPAKRMRLSSQRASLSGNRQNVTVTTPSQNALRTSQNAGNRVTSALSQSTTYDIVTGQPLDQPTPATKSRRGSLSQSQPAAGGMLKRSTSRTSLLPQPAQPVAMVSGQKYQDDMLALQTRVHKLEYENELFQSDRAMVALQHEKELHEVQARADTDHKKYQEAEDARLKAVRLQEAAQKELRDFRDRGVNTSATAEKKSRDLQMQFDLLQEERDDLESRLAEAQREQKRVEVEIVAPLRSQVRSMSDEAAAELDDMKTRFETVNRKLEEKEVYAEELEKKVLELNSKSGGSEELDVLKHEMSNLLEENRKLETQDRESRTKIRRLEDERRSVNIVLEEKRALETQLEVARQSERRADELEMQKEHLEDEKRQWTTLLEEEGEEGQSEFNSPEAVVKALAVLRIEHALMLDRLGKVETELIGEEEALRAIQSERDLLKAQLQETKEQLAKLNTSPPDSESKTVKRLEGQLQLAGKEITYLQAQLETFNKEEETMTDIEKLDSAKNEQISRLETLITEYKTEITGLNARIQSLESQPPVTTPMPQLAGQKRPAEVMQADSEQVGHLTRKNKNLVVALEKMTAQTQALAKELQATRSQLKALRASHSQRVLELRENPTSQHQAVQASSLRILKQENEDLKVQLYGDEEARRRIRVVPVSQLESLKLDLQAMEKSLADKTKRLNRNTEIWSQKAAEFRDVIASVLGYKVTFMPNGKVKVRSMYHKSVDENGQELPDDEEDREDYIEFDGERGTMKVGGGRDGPFGQEISEQLDYWVKGKGEIPCFLAAVTMEFQDKYGSMLAPPA